MPFLTRVKSNLERQKHVPEARAMFTGGAVIEGPDRRLIRIADCDALARMQELYVDAQLTACPVIRILTPDEAVHFSAVPGTGWLWVGAWRWWSETTFVALRLPFEGQSRQVVRDALQTAIDNREILIPLEGASK